MIIVCVIGIIIVRIVVLVGYYWYCWTVLNYRLAFPTPVGINKADGDTVAILFM